MQDLKFIEKINPGTYKICLWIQPGARKDSIEGLYQDCLKIKIHAPPVDNKANKEIISFLSKVVGVKKSNVKIVSGQKNRKKIIIITIEEDIDPRDIFRKYLD